MQQFRLMARENSLFWRSIFIVVAFVMGLWVIHWVQYFGHIDLARTFGNSPRDVPHLKGILFSPFIHGGADQAISEHLLSNTLPFAVLLLVLINAYPKVAPYVYLFVHLLSGLLVWLLAPANTLHIGISGVIYGLAFFLFTSGIFRGNRLAVVISILVTLTFGGAVLAGFFPKVGVSWQSHLFGAISGIIAAYIFRNIDLPVPTEIEAEQLPEEKHFFDQ